jgi:hypothetical protein
LLLFLIKYEKSGFINPGLTKLFKRCGNSHPLYYPRLMRREDEVIDKAKIKITPA